MVKAIIPHYRKGDNDLDLYEVTPLVIGWLEPGLSDLKQILPQKASLSK